MSDLIDRAFASLVEAIVGTRIKLAGLYQFRVVSQDGMAVDVEPVDSTLGLPPCSKVPIRPATPGLTVEDIPAGTTCVLAFLDGNAAKPFILCFDSTGSDDTGTLLRVGDVIMMPVGSAGTPTPTPIALGPGITEPGPPGTGISRVKA